MTDVVIFIGGIVCSVAGYAFVTGVVYRVMLNAGLKPISAEGAALFWPATGPWCAGQALVSVIAQRAKERRERRALKSDFTNEPASYREQAK